MGKGSELKSELREFLDEFGVPEDVEDPVTVQFFNEGGLVRMSIRRRVSFCGRCWNRISQAVLDMELGDTDPIREIASELRHIGVDLEFNSGGSDYKSGQPILNLILLFRGKLGDRLQ